MTGRRTTKPKANRLRGAALRKRVPLGTIRVWKHTKTGRLYRWIKFANVPYAMGNNWMHFATWLWVQTHGPLPAGYCVVHADGNSMNDDPHNHELITMAERLRRAMSNRRAEQKRKRKSVKATRQRWQAYREIKAIRRSADAAVSTAEPSPAAKTKAGANVAAFIASLEAA